MVQYNKGQKESLKLIQSLDRDLRGQASSWDFKVYILDTIFYRYLSDNLTNYINNIQQCAGEENFDYANLCDKKAEMARETIVEYLGYFIAPSHLFSNVCKGVTHNSNLSATLASVFRAIEDSAICEDCMKGVFSDFLLDSYKLGRNLEERNKSLSNLLLNVYDMKLGYGLEEHSYASYGEVYEYLLEMYASKLGKIGGDSYTPQDVSELLVRLTIYNNSRICSVYDPTCGGGSLLLKFAEIEKLKNKDLHYYGQEINPSTYNLCRSNMFLHNIKHNHFHIGLGNTLLYPKWKEVIPFDAIVCNPPYSTQWDGNDNRELINDNRYTCAGVLAPKSKADLAFLMHVLYYLSDTGVAAMTEFPGVLYRGGAERQIRQYLVENNYIDTVIQLPVNLFWGMSMTMCIIVLKKNKQDNGVLFIDASNMFGKVGNKNYLRAEDQDKIMEVFKGRSDVKYVSKWVDNDLILKYGSDLSIGNYIDKKDKSIKAINDRIAQIVKKECELRSDVDQMVVDLEQEGL